MLQKIIKKVRQRRRAFSLYRNKLGLIGLLLYIARRKLTPKGGLIPLKVKNGGRLYVRSKSYDTAIFSQIFIYEELNFALPASPRTILDCGANIGLATLFFKFKYPEARIISIEPESSNFELLAKNTRPYKDIHLLRRGVWNKTCDLYLIDNGEGNASFQVTETNLNKNVIGHIEAMGINDVMTQFGITRVDLLKMDIEGSEYVCFNADDISWAHKTGCIAIEIHEHMHPGCKALIDRSLPHRNYEINGEYHVYSNTFYE